jgi:Flp pilus assembly protein TadG
MRVLRKFVRDTTGAILVEMAVIGPLFILLLAAIIELGITLFTQAVLDGAARDAARLIRIGQVQSQGSPVTAFQTQLCSEIGILVTVNCSGANSTVLFSVNTFPNFGAVAFAPCTHNSNQPGNGTVCPFQPGTSSQIVAVQVTYPRPFIIPWVGQCLSNGQCSVFGATSHAGQTGTGVANLVSTVVFQNEPFP